jgi:hypothetical protein
MAQNSTSARRTALATCRLERSSATGALTPRGALSAIETRTSRARPPPPVSMRPALVGTNISGPRSDRPARRAAGQAQEAAEQRADPAREPAAGRAGSAQQLVEAELERLRADLVERRDGDALEIVEPQAAAADRRQQPALEHLSRALEAVD